MWLFDSLNMAATAIKVRRPNFSDAEMLAMVAAVKERAIVILGKLDTQAGVTAAKKLRAWEEVAAAVNAVARVPRITEEVRRKFKDMRSHVKSKAAQEVRQMEGTGKVHCRDHSNLK